MLNKNLQILYSRNYFIKLTFQFASEFELFRKTEELRKDLEKRHDFSTYACFRAVDERNEGDVNIFIL